jgi:hypothetical protein
VTTLTNAPNVPTADQIAAKILSNPANLLVTDSNGKVIVGTNSDKTGYALTSAYDAAKTAATQTSVDAIPTASNSVDFNATQKASLSDAAPVIGDVTLAASQPNSAPAKAGDEMTLTSDYDGAKTAAQASDMSTEFSALSDYLVTINTNIGDVDSGVQSVDTSVQSIIAILPSSGKISSLALNDMVDSGLTLQDALVEVTAMASGRFRKDYPSSGQVTFYKRDDSTVAYTVTVTNTDRTRN